MPRRIRLHPKAVKEMEEKKIVLGLPRKFPPAPRRARKLTFMDLAGELRNAVYGYYFEQEIRVEIAALGSRAFNPTRSKTFKFAAVPGLGDFTHTEREKYGYWPPGRSEKVPCLRVSRKLGKYKRIDGLSTFWPASFSGLLLVNKQIHAEVLPLYYQHVTFCFDSSNRLTNFLTIVRPINLSNITKLVLHYSTRGQPSQTANLLWNDKHHASWISTCRSAATSLTSLTNLRLVVHLNDFPRLEISAPWVVPLLEFRALAHNRNSAGCSEGGVVLISTAGPLKNVKVHLSSPYSVRNVLSPRELDAACRDLHRIFGNAIAKMILGFSEEEVLEEFREAWGDTYARWQYHLSFAAYTY